MLLQLLLPIFIKGILGVLAVDEHGVVPLGHAQEHDDPIPPAAHTELTAVIELIGDLKDAAVSVFRVIIHKSKINAAILLLGNSFGPSLQLFPLLIGKKVCSIKYILHRDAALHRFFHADILAGAGRRAICEDVILRRFCHGVHCLGQRHGAHGHVLAVPRPRRHIGLYRIVDGAGQFLAVAPLIAQSGVDAPVIFVNHPVGIPILRFQQNGQRNALLVLAIAVIIFLIDPRGGVAKSVIAVLGQYIHPQIKAQRLGELGEGLFSLHGQFLRSQGFRFVIDHAVLHCRHCGSAEGQRQQERQRESSICFLHIRSASFLTAIGPAPN